MTESDFYFLLSVSFRGWETAVYLYYTYPALYGLTSSPQRSTTHPH